MEPEVTRRDALQTLTVAGSTVALSGCSMNFEFTDGENGNRTDTPMQSDTQQVSPDRGAPVQNGRFKVEIDGIEISGFARVKIPGSTTESDGQTTFEDLVMERGVMHGDSTLRDWRDAVQDGNDQRARRNVSVTLLTETGQPAIQWEFTNAWVKKFGAPELSVAGNDASVLTESITVSYDRMSRVDV
ncbi:phage tail protein [Halobellus ruber]|uniref:Phage tail protein n=1 Tax=Halobellus ruber TaxID=2761102 RepID=A0A7J9SL73_9EURY|nr:phage tail protein [Halobellus ruber]MBB6645781.1 phage tail protein [Halobellus ruber]